MLKYRSIVGTCLFFLFIGINTGNSQDILGAFGIDFGYLIPAGSWKDHLYVTGVDQFGGGILYGAELEFNFLEVNWGVFINYSKLDMSDWEEAGDLTASASMYIYGALFKYYFASQSPHYLNMDMGLAFMDFKGEESYAGYNYEYNFIKTKSKIDFVIGLSYKYRMNKNLALQLGGRMVIVPSGIEYTGGKSYTIMALPVSMGLRFLF